MIHKSLDAQRESAPFAFLVDLFFFIESFIEIIVDSYAVIRITDSCTFYPVSSNNKVSLLEESRAIVNVKFSVLSLTEMVKLDR